MLDSRCCSACIVHQPLLLSSSHSCVARVPCPAVLLFSAPVECPGTWTATSACSSTSCSTPGTRAATWTSSAPAETLCTDATTTGATTTQQCYGSTCTATVTTTASFQYAVSGTSTPCPADVISALVNTTNQAVLQQPGVTSASASNIACTPTSARRRSLLVNDYRAGSSTTCGCAGCRPHTRYMQT